MIHIVKKNGEICDWDFQKVINAIGKSADRVGKSFPESDHSKFEASLLSKLKGVVATVSDVHKAVERTLSEFDEEIAKSYRDFRSYKAEFVHSWERIVQRATDTINAGNRENANFDSAYISTKGALIRGELTKELYRQFYLTAEEKRATEHGFLYIHDQRDLIFNSFNCCLFDMANVLSGGFVMSGLVYNEPTNVNCALQVIADIMLVATAQQFGGFTVPDVDKVLVPYVKKSFKKAKSVIVEADKLKGIDVTTAVYKKGLKAQIDAIVSDELMQGFQAVEMRLNSVPSARGDFAFTTLSFGNIDSGSNADRKIQKQVCEALLRVRMKGHGKGQPVTFPKLVFLHNEAEFQSNEQYRELFDLSIECSSKAMYPDYLSVDGPGFVGDMYRKYGLVVSPMGCRAYLSPNDLTPGDVSFTGRANIGAVSLNLPMIWQASKGENFYEDLDYYLEMIRTFLKKRFEKVAANKAGTNPLCFTQGGILNCKKDPEEPIGMDVVREFTASFGITALNELSVLATGKSLHESEGEFANEVVDYINKKIEQFKYEDGYLYALYGTPAESLCGTQMQQFRKAFGVIPGVSDREYMSNSFHCHVTADITPFQKQDMEYKLFHKVNGGHIQYTRFTNHNNLEAIKVTVRRGMSLGFYSGVNFDLVVCEDCGFRPTKDVDVCPHCGSTAIMMINRLCGYVGYGKKGGDTRFNIYKLAEVKERVSM